MTTASALTKPAQIRVSRRSPAYWCVTIGNPPVNVMGPEMVKEFQEVINALEADEQIRVVVFDSAVVILPGNTPHFHLGEIRRVHHPSNGHGPLGLEYLSAKDDPRNSSDQKNGAT
jgi:hypothetical protein